MSQPAYKADLLQTKLAFPRLHPPLVMRKSLLAQLDRGLDHTLTLLSAPAGYGKTTLVSEWVSTRTPAGWVSLDLGDNDPVRFWGYVIAACQRFDASIGETALARMRSPQQVSYETVVTLLLNDLVNLSQKSVLVLEDYHLITDQQIHDSVSFFIDHLPAAVHLVIMTRSTPPLPIARLRANNNLTEIMAADLRFSADEIHDFLSQTVAASFSDEAVEHLEIRTEGWAVGLRLAALALQGRQAEHLLTTFTGSHRHILDYLASEVLNSQPEHIQEFLLKTTFLNRLTDSLCDFVTDRADSQIMLQQIQDANLFLIPLDGEQAWYRYHALFAEAIQQYARQHFGESYLRELHRRAGVWYEAQGFLGEAVEAALIAQDYERAATLMEPIVATKNANYEGHTLRRWITTLPESILQAHPALYFAQAIVTLFTDDRRAPETEQRLEAPLQKAEAIWRAAGDEQRLGEVLAFRSMVAFWQNDFRRSVSAASHALELLPETSVEWRGICLLNISFSQFLSADLELARQTAEASQQLCQGVNLYAYMASYLVLGMIHYWQGALLQAEQHYQYVLTTVAANEGFVDDRGQAFWGLGLIAYEWDDLENARRYALPAFEIGKQLGAEELMVWSTRLMASVLHANGESLEAVKRLNGLLLDLHTPLYKREVHLHLAQLALAMGDTASVEKWYVTHAQYTNDIPAMQQEDETLLIARLLMAQGKKHAALELLNQIQQNAAAHHRVLNELRCRILKALLFASDDSLIRARENLIPVFEHAQYEGYQRLFLDEGLPMRDLLRKILPHLNEQPYGAFIRALIQRFAQPNHENTNFMEALSPQEERVLGLLASGFSNPEIARELVVSVNTIKTQVKSIYRKLNVTNRDEARDVAYHLKLV